MTESDTVLSERTGTAWVPVIGLEVHCQLATATKLFCGCAWEFGAEPNTRTCPLCTGQPGALPVLNREAVELAVRAALAVGCEIPTTSRFDRKNYFYPDLPKGYQITQYEEPYAIGGGVELESGKHVRLVRIHLEEDAGKTIHDRSDATLVDLNRAGVPLIESVTQPDLASAAEAHEYLVRLKEILRWIGASDCDMEKGSLRCDVNVSVRPVGQGPRTKIELKNLNSFRHVQDSIEHEIRRQIEAWESDDPAHYPVQETRAWDPDAGVSRPLRSKEDAHDYRYFPEPDLPLVEIDAALIERQRAHLPELPAARRERYQSALGLSEYDARVLTAERDTSEFFERTAQLSGDPKAAANWIANDVLRALGEEDVRARSIDELTIRPHDVAELIGFVEAGRTTRNGAREALRHMIRENVGAAQAIDDLGLARVDDDAQIEGWCREAIAANERAASEVRAGVEKALGALIGPVMRASRGRADAATVRATLLRLLEES